MKSLYESAFGYITKQIDKRINALQDECDAQVASLEAQKKAAAEFYQVQIDNIEEQVNAKEKEIESIQKAAEARKRELDLQKAQYEVARKENQRTVSVYKDGQMIHDVDTEGIRDAREDVSAIRRENEIAKIENEVDVLNEQKEALEKALEASNKYWDEQIENVERNFDALIKGMEDYKSRWEELGDIAENAKMNAALKELGITEQDIANISEEAFQSVKNSYLGILADLYSGNDLMMQQLSELSGVDMSGLTGYLESTKGAFGDLDSVSLENLSAQIDGLATTSSSLADSSSDASASIENISSNAAGATESIQPLNTEIEKLKQMLSEVMELFKTFEFPEIGDENYAQKLTAIADGFHKISEKCKELEQVDFSSIIGSMGSGGSGETLPESGAEGSTGSGFQGLASAISEAVTVITTQMTNLQTALQTGNDAFADQIAFIADEYIPTWENLQSRLAEIIGVGGGTGDKEGGKKSSDGKKSKDGSGKSESSGGTGSIIDTMQTGGEEVAARLEDPWLHSFNEFATGENSVQSIAELIKEIVTEMAESIRAQCESAAKALDALAEKAFSVSGSGGFSGHAYASGTGGALPNKVRNALVGDDPDHKPELVCDPETGQYSVFTSPTITDLNKGSTVYNGKETEEIFRNSGKFTLTGQSFANGTGGISSNIVPISPDDAIFAMQKKWMEMMSDGTQMFVPPVNAMNLAAGAMHDVTTAIKNNNVSSVQNIEYHIALPNVTNENAAQSLLNELQKLPSQTRQHVSKF